MEDLKQKLDFIISAALRAALDFTDGLFWASDVFFIREFCHVFNCFNAQILCSCIPSRYYTDMHVSVRGFTPVSTANVAVICHFLKKKNKQKGLRTQKTPIVHS